MKRGKERGNEKGMAMLLWKSRPVDLKQGKKDLASFYSKLALTE